MASNRPVSRACDMAIYEQDGGGRMTDEYRKFINRFRAQVALNGWRYETVAEIMNVHTNTVRNWLSLRSIMDGDAVLRCIRHILGGYAL